LPESFNIAADLRRRAAESPDRIALRFMVDHAGPGRPPGRDLSFARLEALPDRYARGLLAVGLRRGDRTLVLASPTLDFFAVMFGMFKMGAIPVIMDPGMGMKNLLRCIGQIGPRAVVAIPLVHAVRTFVRRPFAKADLMITVGSRWFWGGWRLDDVYARGEGEGPFPSVEFQASDEACITFTSGSTGTPKGVSLTHGAFARVVANIREAFGESPEDVWMEAFAAFVFFDVCNGMTTVVPDANLTRLATADPERFAEALLQNA
jgi:olefin beta-lactone synthetase